MQELLKIEVYNDNLNKVEVVFRELRTVSNSLEQYIMILFDENHSGTTGNFTIPLTLYAVNTIQVPVYKVVSGATVPVIITPTPELTPEEEGYIAPYQKTIGEFDMWKVLVFENHLVSLNDAITAGVMRKKGLINSPLAFIMP